MTKLNMKIFWLQKLDVCIDGWNEERRIDLNLAFHSKASHPQKQCNRYAEKRVIIYEDVGKDSFVFTA